MSVVRTVIGRVALALTVVGAVSAEQFDEYGVKAAFVYNFLHFAEWPVDRLADGDPFVICVFNDSPIMRNLNSHASESVKGRPVRVRTAAALSDLDTCHIVFLPDPETTRVAEIAARYPRAGLLIVTEHQEAEPPDSAINLLVAERKVTFDVNLATAYDQGIQLSSKLINLARRVFGINVPAAAAAAGLPTPSSGSGH